MPTVTELREGLAANLASIANTQVSAWMLSSPTPPAIHIFPDVTEYDATFGRGMDVWQFKIQAFVGFTSDIGAQKRLDVMLAPAGATSVKAAAESDKTLGGKAFSVHVTTCSGYKVFVLDGRPPVLGAEWDVTIKAAGT